MSPLQLETSPILMAFYAAMLYTTVLAISFLLTHLPIVATSITTDRGRYGYLDGLRGLLTIGVFIHHSFTAYKYFVTGVWDWTASAIINQLGQTTVALFFIMTGFLFTIKSMSVYVDWKTFYISRFTRLFPLYGIVISVLFPVIILLSNGILYEPIWKIMQEFLQWLCFVCFGRPDINQFPQTWTVIAGVNWSLRYEVLFYVLGFPVLHTIAKIFSNQQLLFISSVLLSVLLTIRLYQGGGEGDLLFATQFLCGITVAYAYQERPFLSVIQGKHFQIASGVGLLGLAFFITARGTLPIVITLIFFTAVAGGFSIGGLLKTPAARWLGDISYGVYLIHGIVLWLTLYAARSAGNLSNINLLTYSMLMVLVSGIAIVLASLSCITLEQPAIAYARKWSKNRLVVNSND